jgi:hypothetical protein
VSGLAVLDGRSTLAVQVPTEDLARIAEGFDRRRILPGRSVYLALVEATVSRRTWTKKTLAERAGVSTSLLNAVVEGLVRLGLVAVDGDTWRLQAGVPPELLPTVPVAAPPSRWTDQQLQRAERFYTVHAAKVKEVRGDDPPRSPQQIEAGAKILEREPEAKAVMDRLDFALADRFYADKVLSLRDFERWFPRISAAFLAASRRAGNDRPDRPAASHVSYDGDRVQVAR